MPNRTIDTATWDDSWFESLRASTKLLFLYLWTNPHTSQAGLYEISEKKISNETKLSLKQIPKLLQELHPKVRYDPDRKVVWIVNFLKKQSKSPLFWKAAGKSLTRLSNHPFITQFFDYYKDFQPFQHLMIGYREGIDRVSIGTLSDTKATPNTKNSSSGVVTNKEDHKAAAQATPEPEFEKLKEELGMVLAQLNPLVKGQKGLWPLVGEFMETKKIKKGRLPIGVVIRSMKSVLKKAKAGEITGAVYGYAKGTLKKELPKYNLSVAMYESQKIKDETERFLGGRDPPKLSED